MTTETVTAVPDPAGSEQRHRSVALLVAAGALVVVVVALVVLLGVVRPPTLATVAESPQPAPPQSLAWLQWERGESCLHLAAPDGSVHRLWCDRNGGELVGWTATGDLVVQRWDGGRRLLIIDPHTGRVVDTRRADDVTRGRQLWGRDVVTSFRDGDDLVLEAQDGTEVWRVAAPDAYRIHTSVVTADRSWIAMVDSADRLLVVPADGTAEPRIWARDVASWQTLVWEDVRVEE